MRGQDLSVLGVELKLARLADVDLGEIVLIE